MTQALPIRAVLRDSRDFRSTSLTIESGRIGGLAAPPEDAPPWFAIPGLRNAHAHLDLSLARGVPRATRGFGAWVFDLLASRGPFDARVLQRAAAIGARAALATGTTAVGDIDSSGAAASAVAASGLKGISFHEMLGSRDPDEIRRGIEAWLAGFAERAPGGRTRAGISPHAPYSTPPAIYRLAAQIVAAQGAPYSTHIAETRAEVEFLRSGTGEFAGLLAALHAKAPFESPPGASPLDYLRSHGELRPGALLAHVNYAEPCEFARLAESGSIVVYCPRSHNFFGHSRHPVKEMLAAGVRVALGTDSLASNASLSMFEEMAFLRAARPDLSAACIFTMATESAAPELDGGSGRLEPSAPADLVIVRAEGGLPANLEEALELVSTGAVEVVATMVAGEVCYVRDDAAAALLPLTRGASGLSSSGSGRGFSIDEQP